MKTMKIHPVAEMLPYLRKAQFNDLVEDIKANGVKVPVLVNAAKDTIIDGRSRWMAAHDAGIKSDDIPLVVFRGKEEDIASEILSRNLFRRHLTEDQRIMLVVKIRGKTIIEEADERKKGALSGKFKKGNGNGKAGSAVEQFAKEANVSTHKAQQALKVFKAGRAEEVIKGKKLRAAARSVPTKKRKPQKPKSLKERVWAKYSALMRSFDKEDHREVKKLLIAMASGKEAGSDEEGNDNEKSKTKPKSKAKEHRARRKKR